MDIYYIIVLLQIILFSLCLLFAIGYLSLRKLSLPCIGCSKGSWWYSCTPNTGYGTKTCSEYKKIHGTISQVINNIYGVIKQFTNLFTNIDSVIIDIKNFIPKMKNEIHQSMSRVSDITLVNAFDLQGKPSCPFFGLDPCAGIRKLLGVTLKGFTNASNGLFTLLLLGINQLIKLFIAFLKLVLKGIIDLCKKLINNITKPLKQLFGLITNLTNQINNFIDAIINLGIPNIIIFNLISFLNMIIPGPVIGVVMFGGISVILSILLPIISALYTLFTLIFKIVILPLKIIWSILSNIFSLIF